MERRAVSTELLLYLRYEVRDKLLPQGAEELPCFSFILR